MRVFGGLRVACRAAFALIAGASATFAVQPAAAEVLANAKSIELNVHGRIAQHCAMGSIGDMDFGDITRPNLSASAHVALDCNVPFTIKIEAANGGLTNAEHPGGQGPYAGMLPYTVDLSIPVRKPEAAHVERSFASRELLAGRTLSSDGGIAQDGMGLTVALGRPGSDAGLLAGNYGEAIVITVTPI